jgi:hypothetical protein
MRVVRGVALGTYYAKGAAAARETPNAAAMRGLVYAIKDNRDPPNPPQWIHHPAHPARQAVAVDRRNAVEYATAILSRHVAKLTKFFGAEDPRSITLVPVPSSTVTRDSIEIARFPTLRLCRALSGVGLGTVSVLAVQRRPVTSKTEGAHRSAEQILCDLERTSIAVPRSGVLVLVDDNVQSGRSLAAVDMLLGAARPVSAFAVAVTDSRARATATKSCRFHVSYEPKRPLDPVVISVRERAGEPRST